MAQASFAPQSSLRPVARSDAIALGLVEKILRTPRLNDPVLAQARAFLETPAGLRTSLRPVARPKPLVEKAMARRTARKRGAVCGDRDFQGEYVGFVPGKLPGCGIQDAVRITSIDGVRLSQPSLMRCETAEAIKTWVNKGAKRAVGNRGGGLAEMRVAAHYVCRTRNHQKGARLSEHSKGNAIDFSAFTLKNGQTFTVKDDWGKGRNGRILKKMHKAACGPFGTVLGPDGDRFHQDHLHFDIARHRGGPYCR